MEYMYAPIYVIKAKKCLQNLEAAFFWQANTCVDLS